MKEKTKTNLLFLSGILVFCFVFSLIYFPNFYIGATKDNKTNDDGIRINIMDEFQKDKVTDKKYIPNLFEVALVEHGCGNIAWQSYLARVE